MESHEEKKDSMDADELLSKLTGTDSPVDVLIVDDVYANAFLVENMLNDYYTTKKIDSAEALWRYIKRKTPKLILLDLMLPMENGFQILEKMKADERYRSIPVIIVSAKDSRDDVIQAMRLGAADYIVKPVDEKGLIHKVEKILGEAIPIKDR